MSAVLLLTFAVHSSRLLCHIRVEFRLLLLRLYVFIFVFFYFSIFFFFSSRRRHTRSLCDWSSDVCSSASSNTSCRLEILMNPHDVLEEAAALRFPIATDKRLQDLMDRNNDGRLTIEEKKELEALAELSET